MFGGKVAIVTGGASGIGAALTTRLRSEGATVVAADIAPGPGDRLLDVRDRAGFAAIVADVVAEHGRLDLLFNNAGIAPGGRTHELDPSVWDTVLDINLGGVVNGVLAAWPVFVRQRSGHLVNTASAAGLVPPPMVAAYATSKGGVVALSQSLRAEGASLGVRVSALCPGAVDTPILDEAGTGGTPPPSGPTLTGRQVMGLVGMKPIPPDRLAAIALKGVARNRGVIIAPAQAAAGWRLNRLSPSIGDALGRFVAARVNKELANATR